MSVCRLGKTAVTRSYLLILSPLPALCLCQEFDNFTVSLSIGGGEGAGQQAGCEGQNCHRHRKGHRSCKNALILPNSLFMELSQSTLMRSEMTSKGNIFFIIFFLFLIVLYSALLRLPPLRFHCADGYWDRTQDRCNKCIGSQTL
jgi:ABC-type multidrug transport system permease subunit